MTRSKEIENAAKECYYKYSFYHIDGENIVNAFEEGAEWAYKHPDLSSLWHDASEEPQGKRWNILCEDEDGNCWLANNTSVLFDHGGWREYVVCELVVSWAYINDLLPKGGGR